MSVPPDERFKNKRTNFQKALNALEASVAAPISLPRDLSGIIKDFEIAYELCWTALKVYLEEEGHPTGSAKQVFATAYQLGRLPDENVWLEMIKDRNLAVHTYDETLAHDLVDAIRSRYLPAFRGLGTLLAN